MARSPLAPPHLPAAPLAGLAPQPAAHATVVLRRSFLRALAATHCLHCGQRGAGAPVAVLLAAPAQFPWHPCLLGMVAALPYALGVALWLVALAAPLPAGCDAGMGCSLSPGAFALGAAAWAAAGALLLAAARRLTLEQALVRVPMCLRCRDAQVRLGRWEARRRALATALLLALGTALPGMLAALSGMAAVGTSSATAACLALASVAAAALAVGELRARPLAPHRIRCRRLTGYSASLQVSPAWEPVLRQQLPLALHPDHHPGVQQLARQARRGQ